MSSIRRMRGLVVGMVIASAAALGLTRAQTPADPIATAVAAVARVVPLDTSERLAAQSFYAARRMAPAWTQPDGGLTDAANALEIRLRLADTHGLEVHDYLAVLGTAAGTTTGASSADRWSRDVRVTLAALRYLRHLERGRLDAAPEARRLVPPDDPDARARALAAAVADGRVAQVLDAAVPPWPAYDALVGALRHYRTLASVQWPAVSREGTTRGDEPRPDAEAIRLRLEAFGDLGSVATGAAHHETGPRLVVDTVAAIEAFQRRHGLTPDGVIGPRTRAALLVPVSTRIGQIALALERLRWLPRHRDRRAVVVNLPMFRLWAFDAVHTWGTPALAMNVIVGRARATPSPVLAAALDHVTFRPYWNVPVSIARDEILPAAVRDLSWLERQAIEIVDGAGDAARVVPATASALAGVRAGALRLRQRPGPGNALGLVSFAFPNPAGVFLHDTPARALFARARRDFSHGCIRVADAATLARWVLGTDPAWPPDRIAEAVIAGPPARVAVRTATDVLLVYLTALVDPEDGTLRFADDLYGHDDRLARWRQAHLGVGGGRSE